MSFDVVWKPEAGISDTASLLGLPDPTRDEVVTFMKQFDLAEELEQVLEPFVVENLRWSGNEIKFTIVGVNDEDPFSDQVKPLSKASIERHFDLQSLADAEWEGSPGSNMFIMKAIAPINGTEAPEQASLSEYDQKNLDWVKPGDEIEWALIGFNGLTVSSRESPKKSSPKTPKKSSPKTSASTSKPKKSSQKVAAKKVAANKSKPKKTPRKAVKPKRASKKNAPKKLSNKKSVKKPRSVKKSVKKPRCPNGSRRTPPKTGVCKKYK